VIQHTLSTVGRLPAIKIAWIFIRHSEVFGGEIIRLVRGDGLETGIVDRLAGLIKERLADVIKGRLRDGMVLLLEDEPDNVAGFSTTR
jgi:hypothetical protein